VIWVASVMNWWKTEGSIPGGKTRGFAVAMVMTVQGMNGKQRRKTR
jgi:hypothetical protein